MSGSAHQRWRAAQLERQGWRCFYCPTEIDLSNPGNVRVSAPAEAAKKIRAASCDHFVPIAAGGVNDRFNKVLACAPCNAAKGAAMPTLTDLVMLVDLQCVRASHRPNGVGPIARHLLGLARKADAKLGIARKR